MQVKWQTLITKVVVWILLESLLNLLGLDQIANSANSYLMLVQLL